MTVCFCLFCFMRRLHSLVLRVELLPQSDAKLLPQTVQFLEILVVLVLVLDLGLDTCTNCRLDYRDAVIAGWSAPSKIRTAVGKSFTRRAARRAAARTSTEGTRS